MSEHTGNEKTPTRPGRKAQPTIYDIARITGVNPSTVSRALSNPGRVNAKTVQRIRDAATALDYRINPMARALPTGRTKTVGLVMSDITNPVYFDLIRGAGRAASSEGYTLVLAESQESPDLEEQTVQRLLASVDGLVLVGSRLPEGAIRAAAERKPVILVNSALPGLPSVVPNVVPGIRHALDHLYGLGHRSLAYLAGPANSWMNALRRDVILDEATTRGMVTMELGPGQPTVEGGRQGFQWVRATSATAVLAYNDLMAIGLLTACREAEITVPEELTIIGFDDIFGSEFTSPPMTTIRTPVGTAGEHAVRRLVEIVRGQDGQALVGLETEFVPRGSTGAVTARARA